MSVDRIDASYLRLSLEDKEVANGESQESESIRSQRLFIDEYIKNTSDIPKYLTEFADDGYSGTSMERPAMKRLLQLVTMGRVRTIIVKDLSRFARNYLEAGHYLEYIFPAYDVRFISINDNFDSADIDGSDSKAFELAIRNLLNEMYSRDLSNKIKSVVDMKKMAGEYVYGQVPYGYKKGKEKNTIVVDLHAAEIVHRIFVSAVKGMTITEIACALNKDNVPTPSVYLKGVRGNYKTSDKWSFESVKNIMSNRIYTGDTVPYKSHVVRVGSDKVKRIPIDEQIVIPDTHEAIISREMFYQSKNVIKSNKKMKTSTNKAVLSGYLICGCCGKKLQKGKASNKNWLCTGRRYEEDSECNLIKISDELLQEKLISAINLQMKIAGEKISLVKESIKEHRVQYEEKKWQLRKIQRRLSEINESILKLLDRYYEEELTKEQFVSEKNSIRMEEDLLKQQEEKLEKEINESCANISQCLDAECEADRILEYQNISKLDRNLMEELVKCIIVHPHGFLKIQWKFDIFCSENT